MTFSYIVPIRPSPSREERRWAFKFTVLARADGRCAYCRATKPLDVAHRESRKAAPEREFDPSNGIALCRSCHMKHDHANGHRQSGRKPGTKMPPEFGEKISAAGKRRGADPAFAEARRLAAILGWDNRHPAIGRKRLSKPCENCGELAKPDRRFCSPKCHYAFRTGKPRSGF